MACHGNEGAWLLEVSKRDSSSAQADSFAGVAGCKFLRFSSFGNTNDAIRTLHGARTRAGGDPRIVARIGERGCDADAERLVASGARPGIGQPGTRGVDGAAGESVWGGHRRAGGSPC